MKSKRLFLAIILPIFFCLTLSARDQWSVKRAQKWEKEVGVLKGANGYYMVNPSKSDSEVFQRMSELGFNSVRAWCGGNSAEQIIGFIEKLLKAADENGMTVTPVLTIGNWFKDPATDVEVEPRAKEALVGVIKHFRNDKRIVYWDLWNEPPFDPGKTDVMRVMGILEKMVLWGREANATQPLTSSIFWDIQGDRTSDVFRRRLQVEGMMDIHNYHDYIEAVDEGKPSREIIKMLRELDGRPIVCSECLNRENGSGIERALSIFAEEHVHFYVWGVYANDRNWSTRWGRSEFDPYNRMFHNVLLADGDPYSEQEIKWIKDFHFCAPGETMDPGIEITDRWQRDRVWKRMALGPVKGFVSESPKSVPEGYNCVSFPVSYRMWKEDPSALMNLVEDKLREAAKKNVLVVPTLLTSEDGHEERQYDYVKEVIGKFAHAPEIFAWNIYDGPSDALSVTKLFQSARSCQSTHPLFMLPIFALKEFPAGFDFKAAMVHGKTGGWDYFLFKDKESEQVCSQVWHLSDVIAFRSAFKMEYVGWIGAVARRYGRPVFAFLDGKAPADVAPVLDRLSRTQLYWWTSAALNKKDLDSFRFIPTNDWK